HTGPYLEHSHGEANLNLLKMARESLMLGLRTALSRAPKQNVRSCENKIPIKQNGRLQQITIEVAPFQVPPSREQFYLVLFTPGVSPEEERGKRALHKPLPR